MLHFVLLASKMVEGTVDTTPTNSSQVRGPCINTLVDLMDAFHSSLKTPSYEERNNSLLDMSVLDMRRLPLKIFRFYDISNVVTNTSKNITHTCCHPEQDGCLIFAVLQKGILSLLPPSLLFVLGVPQLGFFDADTYPVSEGMYCWTLPEFCPKARKVDILRTFCLQVS